MYGMQRKAGIAGFLFCLLALLGPGVSESPLPKGEGETPRVLHLGPVANNILGLTISAGRIEYGRQKPYEQERGDIISSDSDDNRWILRSGKTIGSLVGKDASRMMTFDTLTGFEIDTTLADRPGTYRISSADDEDYRTPCLPLAVYRKTKPADLGRAGNKLEASMEHIIYLKLPKTLKRGKHYRVDYGPLKVPDSAFVYDPLATRSEAVHVSHIGFRPDDYPKVAFVSLWMGSGGPLAFKEGTKFVVINNATEKMVYTGELRLSKSDRERDEDAHRRNFNGTNVYILDFSRLSKPGMYRACLDGVGCSYSFEIGKDVWRSPFRTSARGLYHQRSGISLGPPYTTYKRSRCFHPDDGVKVFASTTSLADTPNGYSQGSDNFSKLVAGRTPEIVPNAWGGYCDAGDWDRRIQHLDAARYLLDLVMLFPRYFGGLGLNIPESGNGVPDVVNEALWGIDFFHRLQRADGAVGGGIESAGHPRYGEGSWQESRTVMAYAPDPWSSYLYAGVAARAAFWFQGRTPKLSRLYTESAVRAFLWAEKEMKGTGKGDHAKEIADARNLGAAELFRLTGDAKWHDIFLETTVFKNSSPLYKHGSHDQSSAAWVYWNTEKRRIDRAVKARCRDAILEEAGKRILTQKNTGFKWMKDPWRPACAGTFTVPAAVSVVRAYIITGDKRYLEAVVLASQTGAGANPLNICYTTAVGHKSPLHVLHVDSRITHQPPPPGLTVLGPLDAELVEGANSPDQRMIGKYCYPPLKKWPVIESFWDVFWYPMMCEFTVHHTLAPNLYVWGFLAARKQGQGN
jgi:endoglucanase